MTSHLLTPQNVPTRLQRMALRTLALIGWHVRYAPLPGPRGVAIVYPHTSNWDFVIGLFAKWAIGIPFRWLAKDALFRGLAGATLGRLMRFWGGEPVERSASTGAIERLARCIQAADRYWLALAPEGTRKYCPHWRSGFYHIALAARVPVGIAYIDYATREIGLVDYVDLTGNVEADLAAIRAAYDQRRGLRHHMASPIAFRAVDAESEQAGSARPGERRTSG
jgi:1-acyl-sn-glycerol-3-phosphate acyltransferase